MAKLVVRQSVKAHGPLVLPGEGGVMYYRVGWMVLRVSRGGYVNGSW